MKFNVNNYVKVKLNDRGKEIIEQIQNVNLATYGFNTDFPSEDDDGYSKWQMWELMSTFGEHMGLGCVVPFDTEIEILEK